MGFSWVLDPWLFSRIIIFIMVKVVNKIYLLDYPTIIDSLKIPIFEKLFCIKVMFLRRNSSLNM